AVALSIALIVQPLADEVNNTLPAIMAAAGFAALLYWPIAMYRLTHAFRYYLRIDRPLITMLIVQLVVAIFLLMTLCLLNEFFRQFSCAKWTLRRVLAAAIEPRECLHHHVAHNRRPTGRAFRATHSARNANTTCAACATRDARNVDGTY